MEKFNLIATATFGLEKLVKMELLDLGMEIREVFNGGVKFLGTFEDLKRANLYLRCADRVQIEVGTFKAQSFEELFDQTYDLPWEDFIPKDGEFPVSGKSINSQLSSVPNCQKIVKKAISTKLTHKYGDSWHREDGSLYKIQVALLKDIVTLTIDTTGPGLHKRGYRTSVGLAPLKETLGAALVKLSYYRKDRVLVDPFCGTGTILIEGAMIEKNIPPGLNRDFMFETWDNLGNPSLKLLKEEGRDNILKERLQILGSDIDYRAIKMAEEHIQNMGLEKDIFVQKLDVKNFQSKKKYGVLITNPPYGERLSDEEEVFELMSTLGKFQRENETWSTYVLSSFPRVEEAFRGTASRRRKLYNGRLECTYYQYQGLRPPKKVENKE